MAKLKLQKIGDNYTLNKYTIILAHRNQKKYGQIHNINNESVSIECNLNSRDTISFSVYKHMDKMKESLWSNIKDLRLVYVKELDEYFSINVSFSDSEKQIKNVTGTSLCESELGQTIIYNFECNTEGDIGRDDYEQPTVFYRDLSSLDPNSKDYKKAKQSSLLHRVMSKCPHYKIKHVDSSLMNIQRSFSVDGTSVYDFFTGECAEQFNCIFTFDSTDRSVSVYDLYTVCLNTSCNYRGDNTEFETIVSGSSVCKCPKCNGANLKYFGEDTTIFVNKNNLTDEVTFETDVDSIKNCFKLEAGDDTMTAAIRSINPNGSDYIYYISPEQKEDMSAELVSRLNSYNAEYEKSKPTYEKLMAQIYECIDKIVYYTSSMMPNTNNNDIDSKASDEIKKLTVSNLSPVGLSSVTESTSTATANSAIKNLAKVYINSGKFKIEIESGEFVYVGTDANGYHYGTWYGSIRLTNYSDEEDTALSSMMSIKVYDNYEYFLDQKIKKNIANDDNGDKSIYNVLAIESLSNFKTALTYYSLNRLISFYDAIQGVIDILIEADQSSDSADLYNSIYVPYYNKLQACQSEIDKRQATIDEWEHSQDLYDEQKQEIQSSLNFEDYLGEDLYTEFCSYRREQKYSNSNYISDGLDNSELFDNAKEFLETAENEIIKSGEHQHSISSTLYNLLLIKDFKRIVDKFELGNWIRVGVDEDIYRLRLISFGINGTSIQNLSVEFSDLTKVISSSSDLENVISQAQQMATSYGNVETQANKGNIASNTFKNMQEEGFNSALYKIKNSDNEEWTFSKHGLLGKSYDDVSNDYLPEQIAFTHNVMAFTDDNWKTSCTALGKMTYTLGGTKYTEYGLNSKFVISGKVIAGDIYSANYNASGTGTHLNLNTGDFSLADSKIVYNNNTNKLTLKGVTIDWATTTTPTISDINGLNDYLVQLDGRIQTYSQETQPTWTDTNANHNGDLWFKPSTGVTYVYGSSTNKWSATQDSTLASLVQSKAQIFTTTPTIPYYIGDLWVQGSSGDIKNCKTTRTSGSYTASDWVVSSKYTDDTVANVASQVASLAKSKAETANSLINDISSDSKLTASEKQNLDITMKEIINEKAGILSQADMYGISQTDYTNAYNTLYKYCYSSTGIFYDLTTTSDIVSNTMKNNFSNYYKARQDLLSSIATEAKSYANLVEINSKKYADDVSKALGDTLNKQIDGKMETWNQITDPSTSWSDGEKTTHKGDIWYNRSVTKIWGGSSWTTTTDTTLKSLADSKKQVFTSTPTIPYYVGDLWVTSTSSNAELKVCKTARTSGSYTASDWVASLKYTDDTTANAIDTKVTQILAGTYKTQIGEDYIISPHIGGGDININNKFKVDSQGNVTLPDNASISWGQITGTSNIAIKSDIPTNTNQLTNGAGFQTANQVTQITKDTVTTNYVNALNVKAASVDAENITGNTISGKTITSCVFNNGNGVMGYIKPSLKEVGTIGNYLCDGGGINKALYDVDNNGSVTWSDYDMMNNFRLGKTQLSSWRGAKRSNIKFSIDSNNPETLIKIYGTNMWGNDVIATYGINGCNVNQVTSKAISVGELSVIPPSGENTSEPFKVYSTTKGGYILNTSDVSGYATFGYDVYVMGTLFTPDGKVSVSDKNMKTDIESLNVENTANFIYSLRPTKFKLKSGESGRFHHGLIAQELKGSMGNDDWGVYVDKTINGTKLYNDDHEEVDVGKLGIRYDELIADLIATCQSLNNRVKELENNNE